MNVQLQKQRVQPQKVRPESKPNRPENKQSNALLAREVTTSSSQTSQRATGNPQKSIKVGLKPKVKQQDQFNLLVKTSMALVNEYNEKRLELFEKLTKAEKELSNDEKLLNLAIEEKVRLSCANRLFLCKNHQKLANAPVEKESAIKKKKELLENIYQLMQNEVEIQKQSLSEFNALSVRIFSEKEELKAQLAELENTHSGNQEIDEEAEFKLLEELANREINKTKEEAFPKIEESLNTLHEEEIENAVDQENAIQNEQNQPTAEELNELLQNLIVDGDINKQEEFKLGDDDWEVLDINALAIVQNPQQNQNLALSYMPNLNLSAIASSSLNMLPTQALAKGASYLYNSFVSKK